MSMYECPKCGGVPGVTVCCSDAQPAQAVPLLSDEEMEAAIRPFYRDSYSASMAMLNNISEYLAVEQAVRAKMGVAAPMTDEQVDKAMRVMFYPARNRAFMDGVRAAEKFHGIVGKEGS